MKAVKTHEYMKKLPLIHQKKNNKINGDKKKAETIKVKARINELAKQQN